MAVSAMLHRVPPNKRPAPGGTAAKLLEIADAVWRLPAYDSRRPEVWYEAKSAVAAELRRLARQKEVA
jgi:hypothetical protein